MLMLNFSGLPWAAPLAVALVAALLLLGAAGVGGARDRLSIIPCPAEARLTQGKHVLSGKTVVAAPADAFAAQFLAERLRAATGFKVPLVDPARGRGGAGEIRFEPLPGQGPEGAYHLKVSPERILVQAREPSGYFYAVQSLLQLLPPAVMGGSPKPGQDWSVPCTEVSDGPRFAWRGLLLDVARHFFTAAEVRKVIDGMALHKLNKLQLHLTDDQGWRVPITQYPKLTEVGAWRKEIGFGLNPRDSTAYGPDGRYGGFYTREEIRGLVEYARQRGIEIIPEIEMPGHASAALSAYPEFSCSGGPFNTDMHGGVFNGIFCPGREATFEFIDAVLGEVAELFPGQYIHIGGDEVDKGNWQKCDPCQARIKSEGLKNEQELQSYFVRRVARMLAARGRVLIGWSEIREGGLAENVVLMDWIGGGAEAAAAGRQVIMTPTTHCYLDYYQSTNRAGEPKAIGGFVPLEKVYAFEPIPVKLAAEHHRQVLGAQGNLWTEYIASLKHVEYMLYPRMAALAEVTWSPSTRDYQDFLRRLKDHAARLDALGIRYRPVGP